MVKKNIFNGVVRIEFENGKATNVACLTMSDTIMEIRHDAENPSNRYQELEGDSLQVKAGERLVLVMTEGYAKRGEIQPCECDTINNLYHVARRFKHDRLRVKIYAKTEEGDKGECVGYAWIGKGKGVAEGDTTEGADTTESDNDLSDFAFIGFTIIIPTNGYSTESKAEKPTEPRTANVSADDVDYTIDAVITYKNPRTSAQTILDTSDDLTRKLADIISKWESEK